MLRFYAGEDDTPQGTRRDFASAILVLKHARPGCPASGFGPSVRAAAGSTRVTGTKLRAEPAWNPEQHPSA